MTNESGRSRPDDSAAPEPTVSDVRSTAGRELVVTCKHAEAGGYVGLCTGCARLDGLLSYEGRPEPAALANDPTHVPIGAENDPEYAWNRAVDGSASPAEAGKPAVPKATASQACVTGR